MKTKTATNTMGGDFPEDRSGPNRLDAGCGLSIAGIYQDAVSLDWAMQTCRRAARLDGEGRVRNSLYAVNSLDDPGILHEAIGAALDADVIVVAVHAADVLPLDLYAWLTAWLPRRGSKTGVLTALIGCAESQNVPTVSTTSYLQAVARKAELDFIIHEYSLSKSFPEIGKREPTQARQLLINFDGTS